MLFEGEGCFSVAVENAGCAVVGVSNDDVCMREEEAAGEFNSWFVLAVWVSDITLWGTALNEWCECEECTEERECAEREEA